MPKLAEWLKSKRLKPARFAVRIGVEKSTVYRWLDVANPTFPQREHLDLVYAETAGEVTAHDFIADAPRIVDVPETGDTRQENNSAALRKSLSIATSGGEADDDHYAKHSGDQPPV